MKNRMSIIIFIAVFFSSVASTIFADEGTPLAPKFYKTYVQGNNEIIYNRRAFSFSEGDQATVGYNASIQFTLNRPVKDVWSVFKDFNVWMNEGGYYFSGAYGEQEGEMVYLTSKPDGDPGLYYIIEHVVPEHLIVLSQPVVDRDGIKIIGTHTFTLTEHNGKTTITAFMQHAHRGTHLNIKEEVKKQNEALEKGSIFINFIPRLKELVEGEK